MAGDGVGRRTVLTVAAGMAAASAAAAQTGPAFQTLSYERRGKVAVVTLNRPEDDNILNMQALRELPLVWETFRNDDEAHVAIFTGAGGEAFCGGVDVSEIRGRPAPRYPARDEGLRTYTAKQNKCWKPVIAAINGFVAGPGLHFVLDADIRIATPEAVFFDLHMHVTGSVPVIEPIEMARQIPLEAVSRMFLLGPHERIGAQRARELGLISEVTPAGKLMERALAMAEQIAQADMHLTTAMVEALYKARELGVTEAVNRGLIIRQLAGYQSAPLKGQRPRDLAKRGPKVG